MQNNYTSIRLEITSKCNLNCLCCHNKDYINQKDDMTTDEILQLIDNLTKKYQINKILLTGGEPLKQKDICRIIKHISNLGIKVDLVTNGTLLTQELVKRFEECGLKRIRISIDEITENSASRSNTCTTDLWKKAKMIAETSNIEVCIHTVASPKNLDQLFEVYKKVCICGAKRWRVFDIGYQGGVVENRQSFNFKAYYKKLIYYTSLIVKDYLKNNLKDVLDVEINNIFKTSFLNFSSSDVEEFNIKDAYSIQLLQSPCEYVANHQLTIRSNGTATLCQYFRNIIFDYKKENFDVEKAIENSSLTPENTITLKDVVGCKDCKYILLCNSGCRSRALHLTDDITQADPVGCYLHQLVHKDIISILPQNVIQAYEASILPNGIEPKFSEDDLEYFLNRKGYITNENS